MEKELARLHRAEIDFNAFVRATRTDWDKLSAKLYNDWRRAIPLGVSQEDVRQEMLYHAWRAVCSYDPSLGSLKHHVVFTACAKALRMLHVQRNSKRRDDRAPSRHALAFAELGEATVEWLEALVGLDDTLDLEALLDARRAFARALNNTEGLDKCALLALQQTYGDLTHAGTVLYDALPPTMRVRLQWSERDAHERVVSALVQHVEVAA